MGRRSFCNAIWIVVAGGGWMDGLRLLHDFSMEVSLQLFPLRTYARGRLMFCSWFCSMERKRETTVGNII